jgi:hypothetical protein
VWESFAEAEAACPAAQPDNRTGARYAPDQGRRRLLQRTSTSGLPPMPGVQKSPVRAGTGQESARVAGSTGFEPAISSVTGWHVRPLHHEPAPTAKDTR